MATITMGKWKERCIIRVNSKLAEVNSSGNWTVGGKSASRRLSSFLDFVYKEIYEWPDYKIGHYTVKP